MTTLFVLPGFFAHAIESRQVVCHTLAIEAANCSRRVEWLGGPAEMNNSEHLRILHRMKSSGGEQITLRSSNPASLPFLVLLRGGSSASRTGEEITATKLTPFIVRSGDRVTLVQQGQGVRLTRAVRCLERGRVGDVVHVREEGGKTRLAARVTESGTLVAAY